MKPSNIYLAILFFLLIFSQNLSAKAIDNSTVEVEQTKKQKIKSKTKIDTWAITGIVLIIPAAIILVCGIASGNLILILTGLFLFLVGIGLLLVSLIKKLPKKQS